MVKIVLKPNETAESATRRLRKILDKAGIRRELRDRERYRKPSDVKREAKKRAIRRNRAD